VLSLLGREVRRFATEAAVVSDPIVDTQYGALIQDSCRRAGVSLSIAQFAGECTEQEVERLAAEVGSGQVIVAAGGGKCLDTGKALAHRLSALFVSVPTVASTDAPTSHNYVIYDAEHRLLEVRKLAVNPALVLVDSAVIARAPRMLFAAGIGDAIGKIWEVEACEKAGGHNMFTGRIPRTALALARASHDILIEDAASALQSVDEGQLTAAVERTIEATILMSGLAFESGGLSIAHSMTRGLSLVPRYATALHGFQIAYANVVQLRLEGRQATEFEALIRFNRSCGLPCTLSDLGGGPDRGDIEAIAEGTMTSPHIRNFRRQIEREDLVRAMQEVEEGSFADVA
jgi:glycerol dehydrogenase